MGGKSSTHLPTPTSKEDCVEIVLDSSMSKIMGPIKDSNGDVIGSIKKHVMNLLKHEAFLQWQLYKRSLILLHRLKRARKPFVSSYNVELEYPVKIRGEENDLHIDVVFTINHGRKIPVVFIKNAPKEEVIAEANMLIKLVASHSKFQDYGYFVMICSDRNKPPIGNKTRYKYSPLSGDSNTNQHHVDVSLLKCPKNDLGMFMVIVKFRKLADEEANEGMVRLKDHDDDNMDVIAIDDSETETCLNTLLPGLLD